MAQPYTGTLTFEAWLPADTIINGATATGFVLDSDTTFATENDVNLVGLMLVYQTLAARNAGRPTGGWGSKYAAQLDLVLSTHAGRAARGDRTLELAAAEASQQQAKAA